ncbi:MAG TPA: family 16 glycosylhydrolase [Solirubrobacteraceae bacterium]
MPRLPAALGLLLLAVHAFLTAHAGAAGARVRLVAPRNDASVCGKVAFLIRPARGVRRVAFAVDGHVRDVDRRSPFAFGRAGLLDTAGLRPGTHRLAARVWLRGRAITLRRAIRVRAPAAGSPPGAEPTAPAPGAQLAPVSDPPPGEPEPVWADEFNGPAGAPPDPSKWSFDTGRWGASAGEQQDYTDRAANVSTDGAGHLRIVARPEASGGAAYTSGRIETRDKFEPRFGRVEARIKVPAGRGLLPAFWLLGYDLDEGASWPQAGEVDVMEITGNDPFTWYGTVHGPREKAPDSDVSEQRSVRARSAFSDDFHVYAIDWRENAIQFLVDGRSVDGPVTPASFASRGGRWVFNRPFFLVLNVAVGNRWTGPPDATTPWPAAMLVDWVRVYR